MLISWLEGRSVVDYIYGVINLMLYILDRLKEMIIGYYERYYSEYSCEEGILCICFMIIEELLKVRLTGTCFD